MKNSIIFLLLLIIFLPKTVNSQYADLGSGNLKNQIWWFNWSGFTVSDGATKTFTTSDGLKVTITFSAVSGQAPVSNVMSTWVGAVLHYLYDFSDGSIQPALYANNSTENTSFTMKVMATRNGSTTPFTFVAANAEASKQEITTLVTDASNWETLDFYRNSFQTSDPLLGCNTSKAQIVDTYGGDPGVGQNPLIATNVGSSGALTINVKMDKVAVYGGMAMAFGVFSPVDRGDLPSSYGYAQHRLLFKTINSCNYQNPLPSVRQITSLKIGSIAPDADPIENDDDNKFYLADEDGLSFFPIYDKTGSYSLKLPIQNTTGSTAYLTGWFDYNRNGVFDNGESVTASIPNNSTTAVLKWVGLPLNLPIGSVIEYGFRFRISTDKTASQNASGFAPDGEVEDYFVHTIDCPSPSDFSFAIDTCNPLMIKLATSSTDYDSIKWNLGNGSILSHVSNPVYSYGNYGNYTIQMIRMKGGCSDTISKTISVNVTQNDIISTKDTSVCLGASVALHTKPVQSFCWSPTSYLDDPTSANPKSTATQNITYYFTAQTTGSNLIVNGDFSAGNTGFTSAYMYNTVNQKAGEYFIGLDPTLWKNDFAACKDHTNGQGNMMLINGANQANVNVWKQTVTVQPNTNYNFSAWVEGLYFQNPAQLQFSINGILIGNTFTASSTSCLWKQFATSWNSGSNTTAIISIVNLNTAFAGNDFALDDIFFGKVTTERDSVTIRVNNCTSLSQPSFTVPDSVCVNSPVNIKNTSKGASSYYWSYCAADINKVPDAVNLGNISNLLSLPVYTEFAFDTISGNYFGFVVNNALPYINPQGSLIRLNFGNSLLNTPTATDLGYFNGLFPNNAQGIQLVNIHKHWYAVVVGGNPPNTPAKIVKIDFGASLSNNSPTITDWGNISNSLSYPTDLYLFQDGTNWVGFTVNFLNSTITRFDFGSNLSTTPVATNLGNIGDLKNPIGVYATSVNGLWYLFVTNSNENAGGGGSLTRLDFGASLSNTPTAVNLGNVSSVLNRPRDIYIYKGCEGIIGYVVNHGSNDLVKLNFNNDITSVPTGITLGNIGGFNWPNSISKFFRSGSDLYSFVTNVNNNTLSRLHFAGCTDSNVPSSNAIQPDTIIYSTPGVHTISLTIDEGLPTEGSYCKQVVVLPKPNKIPTIDTSFCIGDSLLIH